MPSTPLDTTHIANTEMLDELFKVFPKKHVQAVYEAGCDMASIKVFTDDISLFFNNDVGDGINLVVIVKEDADYTWQDIKCEHEFVGHFTVQTVAHLADYDCSSNSIHRFMPGRYFVTLLKDKCIFLIKYQDGDLHA